MSQYVLRCQPDCIGKDSLGIGSLSFQDKPPFVYHKVLLYAHIPDRAYGYIFDNYGSS